MVRTCYNTLDVILSVPSKVLKTHFITHLLTLRGIREIALLAAMEDLNWFCYIQLNAYLKLSILILTAL